MISPTLIFASGAAGLHFELHQIVLFSFLNSSNRENLEAQLMGVCSLRWDILFCGQLCARGIGQQQNRNRHQSRNHVHINGHGFSLSRRTAAISRFD
jgi:hypothetical protein